VLRPVESDVPKILPGEIRRFFAMPGFPPLDIENARRLTSVDILQFDVVNRGPLPLFVAVAARFPLSNGEELWSEKAGPEFIGPLGRDEWQLDVPAGARVADIRVSLFPFEVAVVRQEVEV
jgi:hypothetical protein